MALIWGVFAALTPLAARASGTVTLAWDPSSGTNAIANYKVYFGVASATYTNFVAAGTNTTVSISNLVEGATYYFAATAVDISGLESDYSTEVSTLIPVKVNTPPTIASITNRIIAVDTATPAIPFTIGDAETPAANLTLSGSSDNPALVLPAGIVFGGSGGNRTVTVTPQPGQTGVANITISVSDGTDTTKSVFQLSVWPRPAAPGGLHIASTGP